MPTSLDERFGSSLLEDQPDAVIAVGTDCSVEAGHRSVENPDGLSAHEKVLYNPCSVPHMEEEQQYTVFTALRYISLLILITYLVAQGILLFMAHFQWEQLMDTRLGILLFLWVGIFLSLSMCMYEYRVNRDWNELLHLINEAEMAAAHAQQAAVKSKTKIEALRHEVKQQSQQINSQQIKDTARTNSEVSESELKMIEILSSFRAEELKATSDHLSVESNQLLWKFQQLRRDIKAKRPSNVFDVSAWSSRSGSVRRSSSVASANSHARTVSKCRELEGRTASPIPVCTLFETVETARDDVSPESSLLS